jgi:undecaprenyl-diphosphatase
MSLVTVVLLAALKGLSEVLPISGSGHGAVARLWLEASVPGGLDALLLLAPLAAVALAARKRLANALGEGVRAIARPELFTTSPGAHDAAVVAIATAVSLLVSALVRPYVELWAEVPVAVGVGLLLTALSLASTALIPRSTDAKGPRPEAPTLVGAGLCGLAHGLSVVPGASRIGAALTVMLWLGVSAPKALEVAFLITVPALLASLLGQLVAGRSFGGIDAGACALALLVAFLAASAAAAALQDVIARGKLTLFALWLVPIGLATLAYARALPQS